MNPLLLPGPTVSLSWLAERLGHPQLAVLDASLKPAAGSASPGAGSEVQLPGTRLFDFDKRIRDQTTSLPHMMPSPELFEREVRALGIRRDSVIVVYDRLGVYASPRAWWMFKAMGHEQVAVLDGGLPAWLEAKLPCEPVGTSPLLEPGDFVARPRPGLFCDAEHVAAALPDPRYAVLDARSEGRFLGQEPEPRPGLRPGHMPHALNLPFSAVLANGHMRTAEELAVLFGSRAEHHQKLIFSCGSGVTACILALAATLAGHHDIAVYDGSWSEWGLPSSRPVELG